MEAVNGVSVLLLGGNMMGQGDEKLGKVLMEKYLSALTEGKAPAVILLVNKGVLLAVDGEPTVDYLNELIDQGTKVLACGTCLEYFNVIDKLKAGQVSNMNTIRDYLAEGSHVITL